MPLPYRVLLLPIALLLSMVAKADGLTEVENFGSNPGNLNMYTHVVVKDSTVAMPLVMVLHGCSQTANMVAEQTGWNKLADMYGFAVVYPQTKLSNNVSTCFNWFNEDDINKNQGESKSIYEMLKYMKMHYRIDSTRIFITGLSAGAAMSVVLMATHPEAFNTGAIFAGGAYKLSTNIAGATAAMAGWMIKSPKSWGDLVRAQNPKYKGIYPNLIVYQGTSDGIVNKRNAGELIKQWSDIHGMNGIPVKSISNFADVKDITRSIYKNDSGEVIIKYYEIANMGHALLVDPGSCRNQGGKDATFSVDKNYHSTYQTALDFGLIPAAVITGPDEVTKGEQLNFSVPYYEGSKYSWSVPKGCTITTGSGTNTVNITWGQSEGDVSVTEIDSNGCKYSFPSIYISVQ